MRLADIHPHLDAVSLARRFVPPSRFDAVRFDNYLPDPAFPSQKQACQQMKTFARTVDQTTSQKWWRRKRQLGHTARYLDGGFGTGKTHLLASLWHATNEDRTYLSFGDLTAYVGFAGMNTAVEAFASKRLICIDEFELDDVANTLMVVTFLRTLLRANTTYLAVTSNTLPERLGEQRFSASEFRREIEAIASYFDELRIDGTDYRTGHAQPHLVTHAEEPVTSTDDFDNLLRHLRNMHPVHYSAMLDGIDEVVLKDLHPIGNQDVALLVVQFIDKLYDARIPVHISGCDINELFDQSYRNGGYRKKYGRAESRLIAMRRESLLAEPT